MVKKIFLTAIILTALYSGLIYIISQKHIKFFAQTMWQENMIRMQQFVYSPKEYDNIVLGTSLTLRVLLDAKRDSDFYSLAAGGGDPLIGFEIIKRANKKPKRIFVESNFILTIEKHEETYLNTLYMPVFFNLRKIFPVMQEENQPMSVLGRGIISGIRLAQHKGSNNETNAAINSTGPGQIDNFARSMVFNEKFDENEFEKEKKICAGNIIAVQKYIEYFKSMNIKICFFEVPRDCETVNKPLLLYVRNKVKEIIEKNGLSQISLPRCHDYSTMDGLHLDDESARTYTSYFLNAAKNIN